MKVFGICSGRKGGNTEILMAQAFKGVLSVDPNAEVEFVNLQEAKIDPCVGCEACVKAHIAGNTNFRCSQGENHDNFQDIELKMRAADAIIVSAPCYNLLPPGILITWLNKLHSGGDYRKITLSPDGWKIGAAFSLGGTDWTDYMPNVVRMVVVELIGGYRGLVDYEQFDFYPATRMVLVDDALMDRMLLMGQRVANAVINRKPGDNEAEYHGQPGFCPYCYSNLLRVNPDGRVFCPQCNIEATPEVVDGRLKITFTQENLDKSRWSPYGQNLHNTNIQKGHKKAAEGAEKIKADFPAYNDFLKDHRMILPERH